MRDQLTCTPILLQCKKYAGGTGTSAKWEIRDYVRIGNYATLTGRGVSRRNLGNKYDKGNVKKRENLKEKGRNRNDVEKI